MTGRKIMLIVAIGCLIGIPLALLLASIIFGNMSYILASLLIFTAALIGVVKGVRACNDEVREVFKR